MRGCGSFLPLVKIKAVADPREARGGSLEVKLCTRTNMKTDETEKRDPTAREQWKRGGTVADDAVEFCDNVFAVVADKFVDFAVVLGALGVAHLLGWL